MRLDGALTETGAGDQSRGRLGQELHGRPPEPQRPDRHRPDRGLHGGRSDHAGGQDRPGLLRRQRRRMPSKTPRSSGRSKAVPSRTSSSATRSSSATSPSGRRTTCSPATTSDPAPTRSAARSASSGTTPSTRSCGSASRSPSPRRTSTCTRTSSSGRRLRRSDVGRLAGELAPLAKKLQRPSSTEATLTIARIGLPLMRPSDTEQRHENVVCASVPQ